MNSVTSQQMPDPQTISAHAEPPTDFADPHIAAFEDNPDQPEKLGVNTFLAIFFLGLGVIAPVTLGQLVANPILVNIGTDLGNTADIGWVVSGWGIASAVSFCIAGNLSDIFGRRYIILLGNVVCIVGSIIAAVAKNLSTVIAGSTLIGFSAGLCLVCYSGVQELCPYRYRGLGLAWVEIALYVPWGTLAVIIANEFVAHATWRYVYYTAIIYAGVSLIGAILLYFPPARPRNDLDKSRLQEFKELDFIGILLFAGGLTVFLIGISWAGSAGHAWNSVSVICPIVVGAIIFISAFAYDFTFRGQNAFFPFHLFSRIRDFSVLLVIVFVAGMIYYSMSALIPQATLYCFTSDPIQIGVILLPNGIGQTVGAAVPLAILHWTRKIKLGIVLGVIVQTLFIALCAYPLPFNKAGWMGIQFFAQSTFPWVRSFCLVNAGLHVKQWELGQAVGIIGTFGSIGGSVGNTIFTTILNGVVNGQIGPRVSAAAIANGFDPSNLTALIPAVIENAVGVPEAFANIPGVTPSVQAATSQAFKEAYAYAFNRVFYSTIPFGIVALAAALLVRDGSKYLTNHTSIHLEKDILQRGKFEENTSKQEGSIPQQ